MNHELIKQKMDRFFEETTSKELVNKFEKIGYKFLDSNVEYKCTPIYATVEIVSHEHHSRWQNFLNLFHQKENKQNLNKFEVFLCNLVI